MGSLPCSGPLALSTIRNAVSLAPTTGSGLVAAAVGIDKSTPFAFSRFLCYAGAVGEQKFQLTIGHVYTELMQHPYDPGTAVLYFGLYVAEATGRSLEYMRVRVNQYLNGVLNYSSVRLIEPPSGIVDSGHFVRREGYDEHWVYEIAPAEGHDEGYEVVRDADGNLPRVSLTVPARVPVESESEAIPTVTLVAELLSTDAQEEVYAWYVVSDVPISRSWSINAAYDADGVYDYDYDFYFEAGATRSNTHTIRYTRGTSTITAKLRLDWAHNYNVTNIDRTYTVRIAATVPEEPPVQKYYLTFGTPYGYETDWYGTPDYYQAFVPFVEVNERGIDSSMWLLVNIYKDGVYLGTNWQLFAPDSQTVEDIFYREEQDCEYTWELEAMEGQDQYYEVVRDADGNLPRVSLTVPARVPVAIDKFQVTFGTPYGEEFDSYGSTYYRGLISLVEINGRIMDQGMWFVLYRYRDGVYDYSSWGYYEPEFGVIENRWFTIEEQGFEYTWELEALEGYDQYYEVVRDADGNLPRVSLTVPALATEPAPPAQSQQRVVQNLGYTVEWMDPAMLFLTWHFGISNNDSGTGFGLVVNESSYLGQYSEWISPGQSTNSIFVGYSRLDEDYEASIYVEDPTDNSYSALRDANGNVPIMSCTIPHANLPTVGVRVALDYLDDFQAGYMWHVESVEPVAEDAWVWVEYTINGVADYAWFYMPAGDTVSQMYYDWYARIDSDYEVTMQVGDDTYFNVDQAHSYATVRIDAAPIDTQIT
jgi:hypothetical protein